MNFEVKLYFTDDKNCTERWSAEADYAVESGETALQALDSLESRLLREKLNRHIRESDEKLLNKLR